MKKEENKTSTEEKNEALLQACVSDSLPCEHCDESCYYHCTEGGQRLPKCQSEEKLYTEKDMIESAKYGYEYHATTSFPNKSFKENCKNNFLQHLYTKFGISYR